MVTTLAWLCRLVAAEPVRFRGVFDCLRPFELTSNVDVCGCNTVLFIYQEKVFELLTSTRTKIEAFQTQISK